MAGLPTSSVHVEALLKVAGFAVTAVKILQRGTTRLDRAPEDILYRLCEKEHALFCDAIGASFRMNAGFE